MSLSPFLLLDDIKFPFLQLTPRRGRIVRQQATMASIVSDFVTSIVSAVTHTRAAWFEENFRVVSNFQTKRNRNLSSTGPGV